MGGFSSSAVGVVPGEVGREGGGLPSLASKSTPFIYILLPLSIIGMSSNVDGGGMAAALVLKGSGCSRDIRDFPYLKLVPGETESLWSCQRKCG